MTKETLNTGAGTAIAMANEGSRGSGQWAGELRMFGSGDCPVRSLLFHGLESTNEGIGLPNHEAQSPFTPKKPRGTRAKNVRWRLGLGLIQTNRFDESCRSFRPDWHKGTVATTEYLPGVHASGAKRFQTRSAASGPRSAPRILEESLLKDKRRHRRRAVYRIS
jgi:hypothetical protein